jgi:hypothetical protein
MMDRMGTRITLKPVIKPLREAVVKASPQAWVRKAPKRKAPMTIPGLRKSLDQVFLRRHPMGRRKRQASKNRIKRRFAGEVSAKASFIRAKDVPQKTETTSKTPSAANEGAFLSKIFPTSVNENHSISASVVQSIRIEKHRIEKPLTHPHLYVIPISN